jgi:hypothetical protein
MKRIAITISSLLVLGLASCLKDRPNTDLASTQSQYIAEITTSNVNGTPNAPSSGLQYFGGATLSFIGAPDVDTVWFTVNIASDYPSKKDIPVTLGIDNQALSNYNASGPPTTFALFPDSTFTFATKTGTIKAGSRLDTFYVLFNSLKIDPTQSYMLPISITAATGATVSGNMGTIYLHVIGNPLAGVYTWDFTRWNNTDSVGPNSGHSVTTQPFIPVTATQVEVASGYFAQARYEISFDNNGGVLSNFDVEFNKDDVAYTNANGVTFAESKPIIIVLDPVNKYFEFMYHAVTTSGTRTIIDKYYK